MQSVRGDNIVSQNLLINLLQYSFRYKEKSHSIYQNKFLAEVLQKEKDNKTLKGDFKPNMGFGKFYLINQNPAFEFNASSEFLQDNPLIAQALKDKKFRNYSIQDSFVFFLVDLNSLDNNPNKYVSKRSDYSQYITNNLSLIASVCKNQNKKAQKIVSKIGINSQFLITLLEDRNLTISTRIPIMDIYQNLIVDVANETYLKSFENKTVM